MFSKLLFIAMARVLLAVDTSAHTSAERPMMRSAKKHGHHRWTKTDHHDGASVAQSDAHHAHHDQNVHRHHGASEDEKHTAKKGHHKHHRHDTRTPLKSDKYHGEHHRHQHARDSIHHKDRSHSHTEDEPEEEVERLLWQNRGKESEASEEELDAEEHHREGHHSKHKSKLQPGTMTLDMNAHGEMRKAHVVGKSRSQMKQSDGNYHAFMDGDGQVSTNDNDGRRRMIKASGLEFGMYNYQDPDSVQLEADGTDSGWKLIHNLTQFEESLAGAPNGESLWDYFKTYYNTNDGIRVIKSFASQNCCLSFGNNKRMFLNSHYCYPLLAEDLYASNERSINTRCNPEGGYDKEFKWKWNYPDGGTFLDGDRLEEDEIHCASKNNPGIYYRGSLLDDTADMDDNVTGRPADVKGGAPASVTNIFMVAAAFSIIATFRM